METKSVRGTGPTSIIDGSKTDNKIDKAKREAKKISARTLPQPGSWNVNLSDKSQDMAKVRAKALDIARNTPDVREERVAELKEQIASGEYKVDSGKIADGMLREAIKERLAEMNE